MKLTPSQIPKVGLEILILMHFIRKNNAILNKMKTFTIKKVHQMHEIIEFDQVIEGVGAEEEDKEIKIR